MSFMAIRNFNTIDPGTKEKKPFKPGDFLTEQDIMNVQGPLKLFVKVVQAIDTAPIA